MLTLALGIGANTALFSVMNAVLLRSLPVSSPDRLFYLTHQYSPEEVGNTGDYRNTFGINVYNRLRENKSAFSDVIAYVPLSLTKTPVLAAGLGVLAVSLAAALIPARRAASVKPMQALRTE